MYKKVVVFGGGTGISYLLRGLKDFPVDITAIITVADNGRSTGRLRHEFNVPAVGDIRQVITNLSGERQEIKDLMSYRFETYSDFNGHSIGNLILIGMMNITGSLKDSITCLSDLLDVRHKVYPISEDSLTLMAETEKGEIIEGEEEITHNRDIKKRIFYKEEPTITKEAIEAVKEADLIVFSMGSLYTSILPTIIGKEMRKAIKNSKAKLMYICNAMTQPGETDDFCVGDHIEVLNKYLDKRKIEVVIASNTDISQEMIDKYRREEEKSKVTIDYAKLDALGVEVIESDLLVLAEDGTLKHDSLLLSTIVFSYLMRK
ncbi:MAG: YvcK family protein [Bacilli bacterium]|nr:YvcK family protein [Bacillota bacterium]MBQ8193466.1 YvcK family protein [Bacilli bacterium]